MIVGILLTFSLAIVVLFTLGKIFASFRKSSMRNAGKKLLEYAGQESNGNRSREAQVLLDSIKMYDISNDPMLKNSVLTSLDAFRPGKNKTY
jgi:hypothetical protein